MCTWGFWVAVHWGWAVFTFAYIAVSVALFGILVVLLVFFLFA